MEKGRTMTKIGGNSQGISKQHFEEHPEHFRSLGFYDPHLHDPAITIVGAGGIGSWVAEQVAKLGVNKITVLDDDRVALHNLATTPYLHQERGKAKVKALERVVKAANPRAKYVGMIKRYTGGKLPKTDILISAVDSMAARKLLFLRAVKEQIPLWIDGRIGGEDLRVYTIRMKDSSDRGLYRSTLIKDEKIVPLPCTRQQTIYVGWITASLITRAVAKWLSERKWNPEVTYSADSLGTYVAAKKYLRRKKALPHRTAGSY